VTKLDNFRIINMQNIDYEIIIVGSGLVGSTLACALLQNGMQVALVEAKPVYKAESKKNKIDIDLRTFALTRASERILTNLGVWDKFTRVSAFRNMYVWDSNGEIDFKSTELGEPTLGYIVEHSVIQVALSERLAQFENLTTYHPAKVKSFELTEDKAAMQVYLDNGKSLTTRLLISAEGANSSISRMAGIEYKQRDHGQRAIVATVQTAKSHQETAWQHFLPTGPLAFLPLSESHTSSIVWSIDTPLAEQLLSLDKKAFHQELETGFAFKLGKVIESGQRASFPLQSRHVLNYVQTRLALVGDAAHSILPLAGQGLNLGLLDAATLSEVIINANNFGSYRELRRYERWRKGENLVMLKAMDGIKALFGNQSSFIKQARNLGLNFTNNTPALKQLIMQYAMGLKGNLPNIAQI
jgi:2-octaprenylphenol hydroxylase